VTAEESRERRADMSGYRSHFGAGERDNASAALVDGRVLESQHITELPRADLPPRELSADAPSHELRIRERRASHSENVRRGAGGARDVLQSVTPKRRVVASVDACVQRS
jgi:hypothetical protein